MGGARLEPGTKRARGSEGCRGRARGAAPSSGSTSPPCGRPGPALPGAGDTLGSPGTAGQPLKPGQGGGGIDPFPAPQPLCTGSATAGTGAPPVRAPWGARAPMRAPPAPPWCPPGSTPPPCTLTGAHALVHTHRRARPWGARTAVHAHPRSAPPVPRLCPGPGGVRIPLGASAPHLAPQKKGGKRNQPTARAQHRHRQPPGTAPTPPGCWMRAPPGRARVPLPAPRVLGRENQGRTEPSRPLCPHPPC